MRRLAGASELLDGPLDDPVVLRGNLRDLARINRWSGGTRASTVALERLLGRRTVPHTLLDVGTGAADIPLALIADGVRRNRILRVTATDSRPEVIDAAARERPAAGRDGGPGAAADRCARAPVARRVVRRRPLVAPRAPPRAARRDRVPAGGGARRAPGRHRQRPRPRAAQLGRRARRAAADHPQPVHAPRRPDVRAAVLHARGAPGAARRGQPAAGGGGRRAVRASGGDRGRVDARLRAARTACASRDRAKIPGRGPPDDGRSGARRRRRDRRRRGRGRGDRRLPRPGRPRGGRPRARAVVALAGRRRLRLARGGARAAAGGPRCGDARSGRAADPGDARGVGRAGRRSG